MKISDISGLSFAIVLTLLIFGLFVLIFPKIEKPFKVGAVYYTSGSSRLEGRVLFIKTNEPPDDFRNAVNISGGENETNITALSPIRTNL